MSFGKACVQGGVVESTRVARMAQYSSDWDMSKSGAALSVSTKLGVHGQADLDA